MKEILYVIKRLREELDCDVFISCVNGEDAFAIRLQKGTYEVGRAFTFCEVEAITDGGHGDVLLDHFIEWARNTEIRL